MIVVDSSALIAILEGEPDAARGTQLPCGVPELILVNLSGQRPRDWNRWGHASDEVRLLSFDCGVSFKRTMTSDCAFRCVEATKLCCIDCYGKGIDSKG